VPAVIVNATYLFSELTDMQSGQAELPITCWSLRCSLTRQEGTLNLTRQAAGQGRWTINGSEFEDVKTPLRPRLEQWQTKFDYRPPRIGMPGLAGGLGSLNYSITNYFQPEFPQASDLEAFVKNFVYASGETLRIMYNVAATNTARADSHSDYFINVPGAQYRQFYQITYVPILLLIALVTLVVATVITAILVIYVLGATGGWRRDMQCIDVLRLLANSGSGSLGEDIKKITAEGDLSDKPLEEWAKELYVRYGRVSGSPAGVSGTRLTPEKALKPRGEYFG